MDHIRYQLQYIIYRHAFIHFIYYLRTLGPAFDNEEGNVQRIPNLTPHRHTEVKVGKDRRNRQAADRQYHVGGVGIVKGKANRDHPQERTVAVEPMKWDASHPDNKKVIAKVTVTCRPRQKPRQQQRGEIFLA